MKILIIVFIFLSNELKAQSLGTTPIQPETKAFVLSKTLEEKPSLVANIKITDAIKDTKIQNSEARGGATSGGGGAFVCLKESDVTSAISQDLWEAGFKYNIIESDLPEEVLSFKVLEKIPAIHSIFRERVKTELSNVIKIRQIKTVNLRSLGDSNHIYENAVCEIGQPLWKVVAIYDGEELTYAKQITDEFNNLSWSALNNHEAIYKVLRDFHGDKTSDNTREIVKFLFSDKTYESVAHLIPRDTFDLNSTQPYEKKWNELMGFYKNGGRVEVNDLNQNFKYCYEFERETEEATPRRSIRYEVEKGAIKSKKRKVTGFFTLRHPEDPHRKVMQGHEKSIVLLGSIFYSPRNSFAHYTGAIRDLEQENTFSLGTMFTSLDHNKNLELAYKKIEATGDLVIIKANWSTRKCLSERYWGGCAKWATNGDFPLNNAVSTTSIIFCPKEK